MCRMRPSAGALGVALCLSGLFISCSGGNGKLEASGTIESDPVTISAKVGGDVQEIAVSEGARVKKGDLLARIDATVYELQKELAQARLVQARNTYDVALEDFRRTQALYRSGSVTRKQRDDAEARSIVAQAQVDEARIAVSLADDQLRHATINAPLAGVVTHKLAEVGEVVFPGSVLFSITDLSRVHLTIYLPEKEVARVSIGQKAEVSIDSFAQRKFPGEVVSISDRAEFTPKNVQSKEDRVKLVFAVKISVPNDEELLKPGLPADAVLIEAPVKNR